MPTHSGYNPLPRPWSTLIRLLGGYDVLHYLVNVNYGSYYRWAHGGGLKKTNRKIMKQLFEKYNLPVPRNVIKR